MGKRVYIALAVLALALVSLIVWQALQPREPVYRGKSLSEWLRCSETARGASSVEAMQNAQEAIRQAGTTAIPTLLRLLRAKDSALKLKLIDLWEKQRIFTTEYTRAPRWNSDGARGFYVLGTNAQGAVPALIGIVDQNISRTSQYCAIDALGFIGSSAKEAVPSLLRWATNADVTASSNAKWALAKIDPEAAAKAGITNAPRTPAPP